MPNAIIRVTCEHPECPQTVALIGGCILPKGWGETIGDFADTGEWVPSVFWCPAHAEGTKIS